MPSTCSTDKRGFTPEAGVLYVVATPIGNLEDITLRALAVLRSADLVAAEDTRKSAQLLSRHGITKSLVSYHDHNENRRTPELMQRLRAGGLDRARFERWYPGDIRPGLPAGVCGGRGRPPDRAVPGASPPPPPFSVGPAHGRLRVRGFLSKKAGKRLTQIKALASEVRTVIICNPPAHRRTGGELRQALGDRQAVLARELTKIHEEFIRGRLRDSRNAPGPARGQGRVHAAPVGSGAAGDAGLG
jgi:16S rRNA (cytidine1402-2'-O)-methyltransferase